MTATMTVDQLQAMLDRSPFIAQLAMRVASIDRERDEITVAMPLTPAAERHAGTRQFHGGAIAGLIDVAGDFALAVQVGGAVPTINLRVDYLRPAVGDSLMATARARRAGRTIGVVDIDVIDPEGRLVAIGRGCYSMIVG